ncbi:MAG: M20 family metallopeptidase [Chloroflexi bacterium]|nr:M20 family metallopeptidase [Chloroflexota bacterium]
MAKQANPSVAALKEQVRTEVARRKQRLEELSLRIHANPELAFQETKASTWLADELEEAEFHVERGAFDLPTCFKARFGSGGPVIAFLAEYDALPGLGHACGHNIIATAALGAGIAARKAVKRLGGTVVVLGTPAEEVHGGKAVMAQRGAFADLDAALMVHPGSANLVEVTMLAAIELEVEYFGKAAHAAARPQQGINALEAMVLAYNAINALRQHVPDGARVHGIITDGGQAPNVVPAHSAAHFLVRALTNAQLEELRGKVLECFRAGATATGARLEHRWASVTYEAMRNNHIIAHAFGANLRALGRRLDKPSGAAFGSTDMGNVSQLVPGIHPVITVAPEGVSLHSPEFREAAVSPEGLNATSDGAMALAMTAVDLLADPALLEKARGEFLQGG